MNNPAQVTIHNLPTPTVPSNLQDRVYSGAIPQLSEFAEYDQSGNLLFFEVDGAIYDKDGYLMVKKGIAAITPYPTYPEYVLDFQVVKIPNECSKYFVILGHNPNYGSLFSVCVLDFDIQNAYWPGDPLRRGGLVDFTPYYIYLSDEDPIGAASLYSINFYDFLSQPNIVQNSISGHVVAFYETLTLSSISTLGKTCDLHVVDEGINANKKLIVAKGNKGWIWRVQHDGIFKEQTNECIGFSNDWPRLNDHTAISNYQGNYYVFSPNEISADYSLAKFDSDWQLLQCWPIGSIFNPSFTITGHCSSSEASKNGRYIYYMTTTAPFFHYIDLSMSVPNSTELSNVNGLSGLSTLIGCRMSLNFFDGVPSIYLFHSSGLSILKGVDEPASIEFIPNPFPSLIIPLYNLVNFDPTLVNAYSNFTNPVITQSRSYNLQQSQELSVANCCAAKLNSNAYGTMTIAQGTSSWTNNSNPFNNASGPVYISGDLVFNAGSNVIITGMEFRFGPNANVIIKQGAAVKLYNTTWTSYECDGSMWPGVQVLGTYVSSLTNLQHNHISQSPMQGGNQGYLYLSGSKIENAMTAAKIGISPNTAGGIIRTMNSTFRNNRTDVVFLQFHYALGNNTTYLGNKSSFQTTSFVTDAHLKNPQLAPNLHVGLNGVDRINFKDCSFLNKTQLSVYSYGSRGNGIQSWQSSLVVTGQNDTYDGGPIDNSYTTFYGLGYGIKQIGLFGSPYSQLTCHHMEIQRCMYGILNYSSDNSLIYQNNFMIPEVPSYYQLNTQNGQYFVVRGIYLTNSTGYTIEQNTFNSMDLFYVQEPFPNVIGIWVDNSGENANEIRNNDFNLMKTGIYITKDNLWDADIISHQTGLQLLCNNFTNGQADLYRGSTTTIREDQGGGSNVAGNRFSSGVEDCFVHGDFIIDPNNTVYTNYFCNSDPNTIPDCGSIPGEDTDGDGIYEPSDDDGDLLYNYVYAGQYSDAECPNNFPQIPGINVTQNPTDIVLQLNTVKGQIDVAVTVYNNVIDQNQKTMLISELDAAFPLESQFLRDLLMLSYPLSNEVLQKVIQKASLLNPWHFTEVLLANSPVEKYLLKEIEDAQLLSPFLMSFLYNADTGISMRKLMEMQLTNLATQRDLLLKDLALSCVYRSDSDSVVSPNLFAQNLKDLPHRTAAKSFAAYLLQTGDYNGAVQWISQYPELASLSTLMEYYQNTNGTFADLSQTELSNIWAIANDDNNVSQSTARGILQAIGETDEEPEPSFPIQFRSLFQSRARHIEQQEPLLGVYPNPVLNEAHISYPMDADGQGVIKVFDTMGREIESRLLNGKGLININVQNYAAGLYLAKLYLLDRVLETITFSVLK